VIQRKNPHLGLNEVPVLISDTTQYSEYFKVSDVPDELTSGKNSFKIYGNTSLLKNNTEILVEVTDSNGVPIYHHVNKYVDSTGRRVVGIYVYNDTPAGLGRITILGVAKFRPNGNPVSRAWEDKYNIKWTTVIPISPEKDNTSSIIFNHVPGAAITEKIREYLEYEFVSGTTVTSSTAGTITYSNTGNGEAFIDIAGNTFTYDMTDLQFTSITHNYSLPSTTELAIGETLTFTPNIISIIDNTRVQVQPWALDVISEVTVGSTTRGSEPLTTAVSSIHEPSTFTTSNFTMTWTQAGSYISGSNNSQSFANITLKNLDPISGDVYGIKTYVKSQGFSAYTLASEDILEDNDIFTDPDSVLPYDSMGNFFTQSVVANYWISESVGLTPAHGNPFVSQSNFPIMSGVTISGSELIENSSSYIRFKSSQSVSLYKENEYAITLDVQAEKTTDQQLQSEIDIYVSGSNIGGDSNHGEKLGTIKSDLEYSTPQTMNVFGNNVTFSNIASSRGSSNASSGTGRSGATATVPASFESNTVTPVPVNNGVVTRQMLDLAFIPPSDTDAHIIFVVRQGKWHIGDVSIRGSRQTGFTPNHTFIEVPIPTMQADDVLDFKFEFVNPAGVTSNIVLEKLGVDFGGSNLYIGGNSNQLSGSISIGDGFVLEGFDGTL
jgi:hypothetical protein